MSDLTEGVELAGLLERANQLGIVHTEYCDDGDGGFIERRTQDVEPFLDLARERQWSGFTGWTPSRDMLWIGEIPLVVIEQWIREDGITPAQLVSPDSWPYLKRKLEDPANKLFRVFPGKL